MEQRGIKDRKNLFKQNATQHITFGKVMIHGKCRHVGFLQPKLNSIIKFTMITIGLLEGNGK
jgi:hypothetical protein